ncbi:kinase/pyrophosphorylase, partial [bacterium]|nr:kinase/pyrophosphorylase [bacterium]
STRLATSPTERPGLYSQINRDYFRRIETMEFAIRHDDGARTGDLRKAEIVLLGVSRTFKTPLSIYLAFQGWFVANVPIVSGAEVTPLVFRLPKGRVFCLDTSARQLASLRRTRYEYLQQRVGEYADPESIRMELMAARQMYHHHGFPIIDVTNKPIEEIASEILATRAKAPVRRRGM